MSESEIRKLLHKIKGSANDKAFKQFYYLCYDRFFRIAYYYTKNEAWSQEIVLDAFMKIWEKRSALLSVSNLEDYCFILVKNTALNYLQKENRAYSFSENEITDTETNISSPEDDLITEELFAEYVKALDRLPERCRQVFILVKEEKKSYAQVADELQISVKTVDAQLQKAVSKLKEILRRFLDKD